MHRYGIIMYWSDEDKLYIAEVPELPGCITHGDTQKIALANANEAIQLWIKTAKEFGNPVPEPKGRLTRRRKVISKSTFMKISGHVSAERKSNPAINLSKKTEQLTMNPKAH